MLLVYTSLCLNTSASDEAKVLDMHTFHTRDLLVVIAEELQQPFLKFRCVCVMVWLSVIV